MMAFEIAFNVCGISIQEAIGEEGKQIMSIRGYLDIDSNLILRALKCVCSFIKGKK